MTTSEVLTLEQAAELLCLCTKTVRKLAATGKLRGKQISGPRSPWRFYRPDLLEFIHGHRAA